MKSIRSLRRQHIRAVTGHQAAPRRAKMYSVQTQVGLSSVEIARLPASPVASIQNADGTFKFLIGYSVVNGDDTLT